MFGGMREGLERVISFRRSSSNFAVIFRFVFFSVFCAVGLRKRKVREQYRKVALPLLFST